VAYEASRSVHIVTELGADTDPFLLHVFAALEEKERQLISEPTKAAMKRAKAKGGAHRWTAIAGGARTR
jgi:DNA invertase Pin-like site-specific DNA recombinase